MVTKASSPRQEHGQANIYIVRYLIKTLHFKPYPLKGLYCYADANFTGKGNKKLMELDPNMVKSRSGWFLLFVNCPVIWCSKFFPKQNILTSHTLFMTS